MKSLCGQVALDVSVLLSVYLPVFYVLKASVFTGGTDPVQWVKTGLSNLRTNWVKDAQVQTRIAVPLNLVCFSVPLYLRLPLRHVFSFFWTAYFSFLRGANKPAGQK